MNERVNWKIYDEQQLDRSVIENVEKKIGFNFPEEYKECVIKYHGARPVQNLFNVENMQRVFGKFFGYDEGDSCSLLNYYFDETDEQCGIIPPDVIPFADDPSGNYICFDYRDDRESPKIVFLNQDDCVSLEIIDGDWRESGIDIDEYKSEKEAMQVLQHKTLQFVANSFKEFLDILYEE